MPSFTHEDLPLSSAAINVIDTVMAAGHPVVIAWSSGKDSSVVAHHECAGGPIPISGPRSGSGAKPPDLAGEG